MSPTVGSQANVQQLTPGLEKYNSSILSSEHFLNLPRWKPTSTGLLPNSDAVYLYCIKLVAHALRDTSQARDRERYDNAYNMFATSDGYTDRDIEATATRIVHRTVQIHNVGVTGLYFQDFFNHPRYEDESLEFMDRLSAFMKLMRHFKQAAYTVMCGRYHEEYLAAPNENWRALESYIEEQKEAWLLRKLVPGSGPMVKVSNIKSRSHHTKNLSDQLLQTPPHGFGPN